MIQLKDREDISGDIRFNDYYHQLQGLLNELKNRKVPAKISKSIDSIINDINSTSYTGNELMKLLKQKQTEIVTLLEKDLNLVTKNHYRNRWLGFGMGFFGVPLGIVIGMLVSNMLWFPIGLPIGLVIGLVIGFGLDKKASKEGRQLDVEIKY